MTSQTIIDLFAGCGGASLGFENAGFEVRAAVEADPTASRSYSRNHPNTTVLTRDMRKMSATEILDAAGLTDGECTVVVGCPPCQGFSTHRLNSAGVDDPRNELVPVFAGLIELIRPVFFVFENVAGLLRRSDSPWLPAKSRLRHRGYRIVEEVVNAADYGVPQRRLRFTAIGCRVPGVGISLPPKTHGDPKKRGELLPWKTVHDAIADLASLRSGERCETDPLHYAARHTETSLRLFAMIPHDGGSRRSLPEHMQLECHKKHDGHRDVYGRLRWDRPAGTITGGCTQPSKGRFLHPDQDRGLTLREACRLQGFPDHYRFEDSKLRIALQIGNAVPPALAHALALAIKTAIAPTC